MKPGASRLAILASLLVAALSGEVQAARWDGLEAVAVSPDGKLLATGGQNRVLYLLDATTLTVKQRIWLGARIGSVAFNRAGSRLLVAGDDDTLYWLDSRTGKTLHTVASTAAGATSREADLVAVRDLLHYPGTLVRFLSLTDGKEKGRVLLKEAVSALAFNRTGKQLVILTASQPGDEKKVALADAPRTLQGLARREFQLRHDGQVSFLLTFAIPTGKLVRDRKLWYTSDSGSTRLVLAGNVAYVFNFANICARISGKGEITLFETPNTFNHGLGASEDGKILVSGGMGAGHHGPIEGSKTVPFEVPRLSGRNEAFAHFAVQADGSAYGVTSAFRLVKLSREGKVEKVVPVY
jgi:WD40 repeat protein